MKFRFIFIKINDRFNKSLQALTFNQTKNYDLFFTLIMRLFPNTLILKLAIEKLSKNMLKSMNEYYPINIIKLDDYTMPIKYDPMKFNVIITYDCWIDTRNYTEFSKSVTYKDVLLVTISQKYFYKLKTKLIIRVCKTSHIKYEVPRVKNLSAMLKLFSDWETISIPFKLSTIIKNKNIR